MASGMPATATMDQVTAIAAAYGIELLRGRCHQYNDRLADVAAATTLHIVQSRSMDFSRLAAVDRLIGYSARGEGR